MGGVTLTNFHPLEVVSCWRDPQLQVSENGWGNTDHIKLTWQCPDISQQNGKVKLGSLIG